MSAPPEVLVMAGGQGSRLGALTARTPKPMLPVGGRPLLQGLLEQLRDQGVGHVVLAVRHLAAVVREHFGDGRWLGLELDYLVEEAPLGTAGAVGLLPPPRTDLLVVNGDVLAPVPVAALLAHHRSHGAALTVGHVQQRVAVPYGVLECVHADVLGLREKPDLVVTAAAGVYVLAPEAVAQVQPGVPLQMPELVQRVLGTARVVGFALPGPWLDIGTPETYALAEQVAAHPALAVPTQAGRGPVVGAQR